jgi:hypothetical protein
MVTGGQRHFFGRKKFLLGILITFAGVNQAGQTFAMSDLQDLKIYHTGGNRKLGTLADFDDVTHLNEITAYLKGSVYIDSAIGAAFSGAIYFPTDGVIFKDSALYMGERERVQVKMTGVSAVVIASGTFKCRGIWAEDGETKVIPKFKTATISAAGDQFDFDSTTGMIVIGDPGAGNRPDDINISRGSELMFEGSWAEMLRETKIFGSYDGATDPEYPIIDVTERDRDRKALFGNLKIKVDGGAGAANLLLTYVTFDLDPVRHNASIRAREVFEQRARKVVVGLTESSGFAMAVVSPRETTHAPVVTSRARAQSAKIAGL